MGRPRAALLVLAAAAALLQARGAAALPAYQIKQIASGKICTDASKATLSYPGTGWGGCAYCADKCTDANPAYVWASFYMERGQPGTCTCWQACTGQKDSGLATSALAQAVLASYTLNPIKTNLKCGGASNDIFGGAIYNKQTCSYACQAADPAYIYFANKPASSCSCYKTCSTQVAAEGAQIFGIALSGASSDPHLVGFHGHKYASCEDRDGKICHGRAFSILSESAHALNTRITRLAGPDEWPYAGTWMTGMGFRFADALSFELEMATDFAYDVKPDPARGPNATRTAVPAGWAGLFAGARANGADIAAKLGSGEVLRFGAAGAEQAVVHFPDARHANDATNGPVAVITTPDMTVKLYLETEDITHLDFEVNLSPKTRIYDMHGLLGQSLSWPPGGPARFQGSDLDYSLDSLLDTA